MTTAAVATTSSEVKEDLTPDQQSYSEILDTLIFYVNEFVDNQGGLASLSLLSSDTQVKGLQDRIPEGFEKRLSKILDQYKDYFSLLEGGRVATYKGYENGLIDESGRVAKKTKTGSLKMAEGASGEGGPVRMPNPNENVWVMDQVDDHESETPKDEMGNDLQLQDAIDAFTEVAYQDDTERFWAAFQKLCTVRLVTYTDAKFANAEHEGCLETLSKMCKLKPVATSELVKASAPVGGYRGGPASHSVSTGGTIRVGQTSLKRDRASTQQVQTESANLASFGVGGIPPPTVSNVPKASNALLLPKERQERKDLVTREIIAILMAEPGRAKTVVALTQHPRIAALKHGVISKFSTYLMENNDKFLETENPGGKTKSNVIELMWDDEKCESFLGETEPAAEKMRNEHPDVWFSENGVPIMPGQIEAKVKKAKTNNYRGSSYGGYGGGGGGGYGGFNTGPNYANTGFQNQNNGGGAPFQTPQGVNTFPNGGANVYSGYGQRKGSQF